VITRGLAGGRLVGPRHQFGEYIGAERIGANDLLYVVRRAIEPGAQIDRQAGEKDLRSR
jgi:hypothetical protein